MNNLFCKKGLAAIILILFFRPSYAIIDTLITIDNTIRAVNLLTTDWGRVIDSATSDLKDAFTPNSSEANQNKECYSDSNNQNVNFDNITSCNKN